MSSHDDLGAVSINASLKRARMLADAGAVPAHGNQNTGWGKGERLGHPNPAHR